MIMSRYAKNQILAYRYYSLRIYQASTTVPFALLLLPSSTDRIQEGNPTPAQPVTTAQMTNIREVPDKIWLYL